MINIYKYINSEDVRDHLRNIDYAFTPAECAYIVGISTISERRKMPTRKL